MTTRPTPGPRQTVDHVMHPKRGPGLMVHDNGPGFFLPDDGGDAVFGDIRLGGASSSPPRSWLVFRDPLHGRIEADYDGVRGNRHEPMWSAIFGQGWLVSEGYDPTRGEKWEWYERFETEDGEIKLRVRMSAVATGRPAMVRKSERSSKWPPKGWEPEDEHWRTYTALTGEIFTFRKGGPPPEQPSAPPGPEQIGLAFEPDKG